MNHRLGVFLLFLGGGGGCGKGTGCMPGAGRGLCPLRLQIRIKI